MKFPRSIPISDVMPAFAWKLSDQQIAATATYLRNSWGNAASAVSAEQVAKACAALKQPPPMAAH